MILRDVGANINYFRPSLQSAINHYIFVGLCCCTLCVVQVENVQYINSMQMLHRASCTLPTFFMFYELENTIIIKKCNIVCTTENTFVPKDTHTPWGKACDQASIACQYYCILLFLAITNIY